MPHGKTMPHKVATDLTTIYGFLAYLTGDVTRNDSWARDNYLDLTVLVLMGADIAVPLPHRDTSGPAYEIYSLGGFFADFRSQDDAQREKAIEYQNTIVDEKAKAHQLRKHLEKIMEQDQFETWLNWHKANEWREHIYRLKGIDNDPLARILLVGETKSVDGRGREERVEMDFWEIPRTRVARGDPVVANDNWLRPTARTRRRRFLHRAVPKS